jgi:hypothetical protein
LVDKIKEGGIVKNSWGTLNVYWKHGMVISEIYIILIILIKDTDRLAMIVFTLSVCVIACSYDIVKLVIV